jgi:hypothetical protein
MEEGGEEQKSTAVRRVSSFRCANDGAFGVPPVRDRLAATGQSENTKPEISGDVLLPWRL